jgi:hypothetical protein
MNQPVAADTLQSQVELSISCKNLKNLEHLTKDDPEVVVFTKDSSGNWIEVGRTEKVIHNLNPIFTKPVAMSYFFEKVQPMRFAVYNVDNRDLNYLHHEYIGEIFCNLSDIICTSKVFTRDLTHPGRKQHPNLGTITIHSDEIKMNEHIEFNIKAQNVEKHEIIGNPHLYIVIYKMGIEDNKYTPVHKTEPKEQSHHNPVDWPTISISVVHLCGGDYDRPIKIECWDHKHLKTDVLIGECNTTLNALQTASTKNVEFTLINNEEKNHKKHYTNSGQLIVSNYKLNKDYTFLDYLYGGCEISVILGIDFTGSNGDPHDSDSLHYDNPPNLNEYQHAITAVATIVAPYDYNNMFAVYGFGAEINESTNHCFPLNGNPNNPEVFGVQGILNLYQTFLDTVTLSGPTYFAKVIDTAEAIASRTVTQQQQKYYVLLMITDGSINDESHTFTEIQKSRDQPLTILIVGVGSHEFADMHKLEGPHCKFLPMRDYKELHHSELARDILAEIPREFLSFMKSKGMVPNPRRVITPSTSVAV